MDGKQVFGVSVRLYLIGFQKDSPASRGHEPSRGIEVPFGHKNTLQMGWEGEILRRWNVRQVGGKRSERDVFCQFLSL